MGEPREWKCERCGHALLRGNWCGQVRPGNQRPDAVAAILHAVAVNPCCDGECKLPAGADPIVWQIGVMALERADCPPGLVVPVRATSPCPFLPRRVAVIEDSAPHFDLVLPAELYALTRSEPLYPWEPRDAGDFVLEVRNNTVTRKHFGGAVRGYFRSPNGPLPGDPTSDQPIEIT